MNYNLFGPQRSHRIALRSLPRRDDSSDQGEHHAQEDQDDRRSHRKHRAHLIGPCQMVDQRIARDQEQQGKSDADQSRAQPDDKCLRIEHLGDISL